MKSFLNIFIIVFLFSCSNNTFKIEDTQAVKFEEAYYQKITSGVKGGGAGINIILISKEDIEDDSIQIEGIYFKDSYAELKFYEPNKFQGFIRTKGNTKEIILLEEDKEQKKKINKEKEEKIPFKLSEGEAVVSYMKNDKKRYFKITLIKKNLKHIPM